MGVGTTTTTRSRSPARVAERYRSPEGRDLSERFGQLRGRDGGRRGGRSPGWGGVGFLNRPHPPLRSFCPAAPDPSPDRPKGRRPFSPPPGGGGIRTPQDHRRRMLRAPVVNAKHVLSGPCPPYALRALVHSCQRGGMGKGTKTRKPSGRRAAKGGPPWGRSNFPGCGAAGGGGGCTERGIRR